MSKGNMLLGHARGKVGSVVFSRLKGQQVTRALNPNPNNPRTAAQMYQRALFADAVKFFTRGRRNLFQFAFENKKANESDYNAFMRENAKRGVVISKAAFDNYGYPALGNWIMSKGTLVPTGARLSANDGITAQFTRPGTTVPTITTLGQLSALIIDGVDYLAGDIITIVNIEVTNATGIPSVEGTQGNTQWYINQIMLDANSTQPLADFGIAATAEQETSSTIAISIVGDFAPTANSIVGGVAIHSRNTATGVRVSTEEMVYNATATTAIEAARERTYIDAVVESWRITQQAPVVSESVMQGNIAQSIAADFEPAGE